MSYLNDIPLTSLHFYLTAPYTCSYLPGLMTSSQVAAPTSMINTQVYSVLVKNGFRRSGIYTYRPFCEGCSACVPLRVPARQFTPNRSQRRALAQHANLQATIHCLLDRPEYFDLYQRYQRARHPDGEMCDRESYQNFILQSNVDSLLVEFRENDVLRMISVIDMLSDGLSSVYTFYEPDLPRACFGVYNVLWQIEMCNNLNLDFVYLGYWIKNCRKMAYKTSFQPAQGLTDGVWQTIRK